MATGLKEKQCSKCQAIKPYSAFHKDPRKRSGLRSDCRECRKKYKAKYRAENKETIRAYTRAYQERQNEVTRAWRERNREKVLEGCRQHYRENIDQVRAYYRENKEAFLIRLRNRRARLREAEGSHTSKEISQMHEDQGGLCAYCGVDLNGEFHVDHMVPISRGGRNDWTNLAVTCPFCNWSKNDRTAEEFVGRMLEREKAAPAAH